MESVLLLETILDRSSLKSCIGVLGFCLGYINNNLSLTIECTDFCVALFALEGIEESKFGVIRENVVNKVIGCTAANIQDLNPLPEEEILLKLRRLIDNNLIDEIPYLINRLLRATSPCPEISAFSNTFWNRKSLLATGFASTTYSIR